MPFSCAVSKVCFFWTKTPSRRGSGSSLCCHILPVVWLIFFLSARAALAWRVARAMSDPGGKLSVARSLTTTLLRMMRYVSELRLLSSAVLCFLFLPFRTVGMYFENTVLHVAQAGGCSSPVVASTRTRRRCHSWGIFFFFHRAYIVFSVLQVFCCSFFPLWYDAHSSTRPSIHTRPPFFFSFSDVLSVGTCCEYTHAPGGDVTLGVFVFSPTVRTYIFCFLRVFCCSFSPPYKCDAHSSAAVRGHTLGLPSVSLLSPSSGCVLFVFAF